MRYFDRSTIARPKCLDMDSKTSAAYKELTKNIKNKNKKVFNVYSNDAVKIALEKLFHGKCSYCESYYSATQPIDVEHFRPKNAKEGYFWLAAVWENLLPSCIDCNRERHQLIVDPFTGKVTKKRKTGKHDHFPLSGVKATAVFDSSFIINNANLVATIENEESLLLNPTVDKVDSLLTFTSDAIIAPSRSVLTMPREMARVDKTIELLGLNRMGLVARRKEVLISLNVLIYTVEKLTLLLADSSLAPLSRDLVKDLLFYLFKEMHRCSAPASPYSLMCRSIIEQKMGKLPSVAISL